MKKIVITITEENGKYNTDISSVEGFQLMEIIGVLENFKMSLLENNVTTKKEES